MRFLTKNVDKFFHKKLRIKNSRGSLNLSHMIHLFWNSLLFFSNIATTTILSPIEELSRSILELSLENSRTFEKMQNS